MSTVLAVGHQAANGKEHIVAGQAMGDSLETIFGCGMEAGQDNHVRSAPGQRHPIV